jgi:hypothetical protein
LAALGCLGVNFRGKLFFYSGKMFRGTFPGLLDVRKTFFGKLFAQVNGLFIYLFGQSFRLSSISCCELRLVFRSRHAIVFPYQVELWV